VVNGTDHDRLASHDLPITSTALRPRHSPMGYVDVAEVTASLDVVEMAP
jgi:hypothetical protein